MHSSACGTILRNDFACMRALSSSCTLCSKATTVILDRPFARARSRAAGRAYPSFASDHMRTLDRISSVRRGCGEPPPGRAESLDDRPSRGTTQFHLVAPSSRQKNSGRLNCRSHRAAFIEIQAFGLVDLDHPGRRSIAQAWAGACGWCEKLRESRGFSSMLGRLWVKLRAILNSAGP